MHSAVVAHQSFALRALSWLGQIIQYSGKSATHYPQSLISLPIIPHCVFDERVPVADGLRRVLCEVGLQKGPEGENSSLVDQLMLNDSKMWKGPSNILIINSLL
ncbi:E3 ubiquitin-protein ligase UBR2 [Liparis tanakae]|uniref:E3 ubiquitin-protein ligase UBR2 n=1 Tax=Liparis tanakae TaxID=230148 RepID=A0A4Z2EHU6_9TELE|nr:E3 ubiquitin-protein ligase UBR2 [Liparis tanakae]